jgi:hypothetical protein
VSARLAAELGGTPPPLSTCTIAPNNSGWPEPRQHRLNQGSGDKMHPIAIGQTKRSAAREIETPDIGGHERGPPTGKARPPFPSRAALYSGAEGAVRQDGRQPSPPGSSPTTTPDTVRRPRHLMRQDAIAEVLLLAIDPLPNKGDLLPSPPRMRGSVSWRPGNNSGGHPASDRGMAAQVITS